MNPIEQYRPDEWELLQPLDAETMLELGGKWCSQAGVTYKSVFEDMGIQHISVDWNGEHGALALDLRKPLDLGHFDVVTNFGCSEHVDRQDGFWANVHRAVKVGGLYVGQTPYPDGQSWQWHGDYYVTEKFYEEFARLNGWKIERLYRGGNPPRENLYCRMVKLYETLGSEFTMPRPGLIYRNLRPEVSAR